MDAIAEKQMEFSHLIADGKRLARAFREGRNDEDLKAEFHRITESLSVLDPKGELLEAEIQRNARTTENSVSA
jgi:ppGpp synthetase/RelA/SpoT-type nucleotidyltranferase